MKRQASRVLLLLVLICAAWTVPTVAHADVGSTIVERFWDSAINMWKTRLQSQSPTTVTLLQEAEKIYLGDSEDITTMAPIQDAYRAMRVAGLLLLALCTVISLAGVAEASMMGHSSDFTEWIKRFCVATFMTMGGIHFYGLWIRIFNVMLGSFRQYLDTHWTGPNDPSAIYTQMIAALNKDNLILLILFAVVTLVVLLVLWFLIGGIRMAEMALAVIIAPLVWPLYLIPSLDDIPKAAFRMFLGLNALLLIVVAMLRLAVRMVAGGGVVNTIWNFVPAVAMLSMTVFLPTMIKRLVGQGNTGTTALTTAMYALAGLKGIGLMASGSGAAGAAAAAAKPPAAGAVPQAPASASAYPVAPMTSAPMSTAPSSQRNEPPMEEVWVRAPRQMHAGAAQAAMPAIEGPWAPDETVIDLGQSRPGSGEFDVVLAINRFMQGSQAAQKPNPNPEE